MLIVRTQSSGEFPDAFRGVELRAVGWQKIQVQHRTVCVEPRMKVAGMMPACVVQDQPQHASAPSMTQETCQKSLKRPCGKPLVLLIDELACAHIDGAIEADVLACGRMEYHRILLLRRYPHGAAGTVLLKVALILKPQVNAAASCDAAKFFYMPLVVAGQRALSPVSAFVAESRDCGTAAGIVARPRLPRTVREDDGSAVCHPTGSVPHLSKTASR